MTDRPDLHLVDDPFGTCPATTPETFDFDRLRGYVMENRQSIVTTIQVIDAEILDYCQRTIGEHTAPQDMAILHFRRPIILIVDDEGRLVDLDGHHILLARSRRHRRTIAVHRIRVAFARQHFSLPANPSR